MAITYTYNIQELKLTPIVGDLENVITEVIYSYVGTDENGITSTYPGRTTLPTPTSSSFTAVTNLTPELIVSWLEINANLDEMKRAVQSHITQQAGVIYKGDTLPWTDIEALVTESSVLPERPSVIVEMPIVIVEEVMVEEPAAAIEETVIVEEVVVEEPVTNEPV